MSSPFDQIFAAHDLQVPGSSCLLCDGGIHRGHQEDDSISIILSVTDRSKLLSIVSTAARDAMRGVPFTAARRAKCAQGAVLVMAGAHAAGNPIGSPDTAWKIIKHMITKASVKYTARQVIMPYAIQREIEAAACA